VKRPKKESDVCVCMCVCEYVCGRNKTDVILQCHMNDEFYVQLR
jgi:hypothetical protein